MQNGSQRSLTPADVYKKKLCCCMQTQVAGTIVTYELVLIQFNEADKSPKEPCS